MTTDATTIADILSRVTKFKSRITIQNLLLDYWHGFEKRDYVRFLSIWPECCVWDIGPPLGRFEGHAGIHKAIHHMLWPPKTKRIT